jgi:hypothetical protein
MTHDGAWDAAETTAETLLVGAMCISNLLQDQRGLIYFSLDSQLELRVHSTHHNINLVTD